jgi:hypothetical protein
MTPSLQSPFTGGAAEHIKEGHLKGSPTDILLSNIYIGSCSLSLDPSEYFK